MFHLDTFLSFHELKCCKTATYNVLIVQRFPTFPLSC
eukprot:UN10154